MEAALIEAALIDYLLAGAGWDNPLDYEPEDDNG